MPSTRRALLGAAAGALAGGLAGCSALSGSATSSRHVPPRGDPVTDYAIARHVVDGERQLFHWTGDDDRPDEQLFLATPAERSAVSFDDADGSPVAGFAAETDLETHSLVLVQARHGACQRLDVFGVTKRPDEVRLHRCRAPRPADEQCSMGDRQSTALAVRLPFDGRSLSEGLNAVESSRCEDRFGPYRDGGANR